MSGCTNSGAAGSWIDRQTISPVINRYTPMPMAKNSTASKTIFRSAVKRANGGGGALGGSRGGGGGWGRPAPRSRHIAQGRDRRQREPTLQRHPREHPQHNAVFGQSRPNDRAGRHVCAQPKQHI